MYLIGALVLSAMSLVRGGWVRELTGNGLHFGNGLTLRLDSVKAENASLLEKHELRMDYSGMGVSVGKTPHQDKLQIGLFYGDNEEGRGKKMGQLIVPVMMGFKATAMGALMMATVGALVLKSLMLAKVSLIVSSILALTKLFGSQERKQQKATESIKHMAPVIYSYPTVQAADYGPSSVGGSYAAAYANYPATAHEAAESTAQYALVASPSVNASQDLISLNSQAVTLQRREFAKRKSTSTPYIRVKKYSYDE